MADTKISALTSATTPLAGTEVLPIVQSGATVKVSVANLTAGRNIAAADIYASGNIAVGTLSGTQKLEVGPLGVFRLQTGSTTMDCTPTPGGIDGFVWNVSAGYYDWNIAGSLKVRLTSTSKFLIGTATDSGSKLVIAGDLGSSVGNGASSIRMTNTATGNYASISAGLPGVTNDGMDFSVDGTRRMSLDGSGNLLIGTSGTVNNTRLRIVGGSTSGSNYTLLVEGSGGADNFYVRDDGELYSLPTYNRTSAGASNVGVDAGGGFFRSTSSLKYKTDVNDATHGLAELLTLRPVTYKGKNDGQTIFGGLIAEQVHEAGLSEFVQYAEDGSPDALSYGNMVSLCIKAIQEQQAIITDLTTRLSALEAK